MERRNSNSTRIGQYITKTFSIVAIGLAIYAVVLANSNIDCSSLQFCDNNLATFIGIFFTVMGVVLSLYFVIIGINVYNIKKDLEQELAEIRQKEEQTKETMECSSDSLYDYFGDLIEIIKIMTTGNLSPIPSDFSCPTAGDNNENVKRIRNRVKRAQAIFACKAKSMSIEKRKSGILTLASVCESNRDIVYLDAIIECEEESKDIVKTAKKVKEQIKTKYPS